MDNQFDNVSRRTRQYWFSDGLVEIFVGVTFLILGFYFFLQAALPADSMILIILQMGFVVLLIGTIFVSRFFVNKIKIRLTYPRTGFVKFKAASRKQRVISAGLAMVIASLSISLFLSKSLSLNWIPATTGLIVGIVWLISAVRVSLLRFYLQSIASFLLGIGLSLSGMDTYPSLAVYYAGMGLILLISGCVILIRYLHDFPTEGDTPL